MRISIKQLKSDIAGPILFQQDNTIKSNIIFRWNYGASRLEIGAADLTDTVILNQGGLQFNTPTYGSTIYPRQNDSNFGNVLGNGVFEIATYSTAGLILGTISNKPVVLGTNNLPRIYIDADGDISLTSLAGSGTQMVVADTNGYLSKIAIPNSVIGLNQIGYGDPSTGILTSDSAFKYDPITNSLRIDTVLNDAKMLLQGWTGISTTYPAIYALLTATAPTASNFLLASDLVNTYINSISGDIRISIAGSVSKIVVTTGGTGTTYFDGGKMSIGAALTGGYNGAYGTYNSRLGGGLDRHFVGESTLNATGSIAMFELRNYLDVTSRFANYANVGTTLLTGTAISVDAALRIDNTIGTYSNNLLANGKIISTGSEIFGIIGTTATNYGQRLDSLGLRIGQLNNLHTANTYPFQVDGVAGSLINGLFYTNSSISNNYLSVYYATLGVEGGIFGLNLGAFGQSQIRTGNTIIELDRVTGQGYIDINISGSKFKIGYDYLQSTILAGTGNRLIEADATGLLSATRIIRDEWIVDITTINLLEDIANWDILGEYIGAVITGTYGGQSHFNSNYYFKCVSDNVWIRMVRG